MALRLAGHFDSEGRKIPLSEDSLLRGENRPESELNILWASAFASCELDRHSAITSDSNNAFLILRSDKFGIAE